MNNQTDLINNITDFSGSVTSEKDGSLTVSANFDPDFLPALLKILVHQNEVINGIKGAGEVAMKPKQLTEADHTVGMSSFIGDTMAPGPESALNILKEKLSSRYFIDYDCSVYGIDRDQWVECMSYCIELTEAKQIKRG